MGVHLHVGQESPDAPPGGRADSALAYAGLHDPLTGLPNRALLMDRLSTALASAGQSDRHVAVALLNLDRFNRVNSGLGHAAGDELLRAVADRLARLLPGGGTLSRCSADEFVVLWTCLDPRGDTGELAGQLMSAFAQPFDIGGSSLWITASLGLAAGAAPRSADELLVAAMREARGHGPGLTRIAPEPVPGVVDSPIRTETELREGLTRGEFALYYQPVVDLRRNAVTGVEALVRWNHPTGQLRPPDTFIPVAEACGLIVPLGRWVLEEACRQGAAWSSDGLHLNIAVNFSVQQLLHPEAIGAIGAALSDSGLPPGQLTVELTESTVMEDAEAARTTLSDIAALGASVAIDDFGTGFSSLHYLKRYPIHAIKIDRSFVAGIGVNVDDDAIVTSVLALARAVGAVCTAEGVETAAQLSALRALGCQFGQGYLFGRPVPAHELPAAIAGCDLRLHEPPAPASPPRRTVSAGAVSTRRLVLQPGARR